MTSYKTDLLDIRLGDCMDLMRDTPDNHWDLAIVDPPYFEKGGDSKYYRPRATTVKRKKLSGDGWKIPDSEYFSQLFRTSKRQIVWGCNYYAKHIPHSGRIVWDKCNDNTPFSQCDIASYSEGVKLWLYRYKWNGMIQQDMKNKETRIHPTQKPVALYNWILHNYAKPGDRILDTHLGSMSIAIACHYKGFHLTGTELDPDYFKAGVERVKRETAQTELFGTASTQEHQQGTQSGDSDGCGEQ